MKQIIQFFDLRDVLALVGAGALVYGIAQLSTPAAWILTGMLLLGVALWSSVRPSVRR